MTYSDCDKILLDDIDLVTREVFLPLLCSDDTNARNMVVSADRLMDQLHRVTANAEVSSGYIKVCWQNALFRLNDPQPSAPPTQSCNTMLHPGSAGKLVMVNSP